MDGSNHTHSYTKCEGVLLSSSFEWKGTLYLRGRAVVVVVFVPSILASVYTPFGIVCSIFLTYEAIMSLFTTDSFASKPFLNCALQRHLAFCSCVRAMFVLVAVS